MPAGKRETDAPRGSADLSVLAIHGDVFTEDGQELATVGAPTCARRACRVEGNMGKMAFKWRRADQ